MKASLGSTPQNTTPLSPENTAVGSHPRSVLTREILADLDTPVSTFLKVGNKPNSYLFESVTGGDKWGRYSIIGLPCRESVSITGHHVSRIVDGKVIEEIDVDDPLQWVEAFQSQYFMDDYAGLPRFVGGLVGFFGYETIAYIEQKLAGVAKEDPLGTPDIALLVSNEVIVFDNLLGKLLIVVHVARGEEAAGQARLDQIERELRAPLVQTPAAQTRQLDATDFTSSFGQNAFIAGVDTIRDYITAGDCMQVVLSQRLSAPFNTDALSLYRALRLLNPSPYMYYLNFGDYQIVGSSPEILVRLEDNEVTVRPIAGTRPRGATDEQDHAFEESLLADPKELAEH
ncbi:MAG: chorismate-binding protein, partial [Pseudomonadota bacterium]